MFLTKPSRQLKKLLITLTPQKHSHQTISRFLKPWQLNKKVSQTHSKNDMMTFLRLFAVWLKKSSLMMKTTGHLVQPILFQVLWRSTRTISTSLTHNKPWKPFTMKLVIRSMVPLTKKQRQVNTLFLVTKLFNHFLKQPTQAMQILKPSPHSLAPTCFKKPDKKKLKQPLTLKLKNTLTPC